MRSCPDTDMDPRIAVGTRRVKGDRCFKMFLIAALRVFRVVFVDRYLSAPEYTTVISTARSENYILG